MSKLYLIGMKLSYALKRLREENIDHRVISEDGKSYAVTHDFDSERYNLTVNKDIITDVSYG